MSSINAEVIFPYDAEQEDELSLVVGTIITNINIQDEGWWEGEVNGKRGVFPENFVKLIKDEASTEIKPALFPKATVTFDYEATEPDEIDLKKGDIIDVLKQAEEGWWEGRFNEKVGLFPSNFVELLTDEKADTETAASEEALPPNPELPMKETHVEKEPNQEKPQLTVDEDLDPKKGKPAMGFGFSISNADLTKARLRPVSGTEEAKITAQKSEEANKPTQRVPPLGQADNVFPSLKKTEPVVNSSITKRNAPAPPSNQGKPELAPSPTGERFVAKFSYEPENDDELALTVGDVVMVINKDVCEGWWEGTFDGKTGVFPNNFVDPAPLAAAAEVKPKEKEKPLGKKPITPHGAKMPILPVKKTEPKDPTKSDVRPFPPEVNRPVLAESKNTPPQDFEKRVPMNSIKSEPKKPELNKPELNKPDLKKPELKKLPPPISKSKPVPPKPSFNKPVLEEPQKTNSTKNVLNNALFDRRRVASVSKKPPMQPPNQQPHQPIRPPLDPSAQPVKEHMPQRPEKPKIEQETKTSKESKPEEVVLDLDSISSANVLQNVNKTRAKGPGKSLPGKYTQHKETSSEESDLNSKKEIPVKEQPKPVTLEQLAAKPALKNEATEELKRELSSIRNKMTEMEKKFMKYIKVLTDDLDSEKKERATLQIEIDRLKKKVNILEGL